VLRARLSAVVGDGGEARPVPPVEEEEEAAVKKYAAATHPAAHPAAHAAAAGSPGGWTGGGRGNSVHAGAFPSAPPTKATLPDPSAPAWLNRPESGRQAPQPVVAGGAASERCPSPASGAA
jgi:hypothetical protein